MENRIADCREQRDIKQNKVAEFLGVSYKSLSGWENNRDHIPLKRLVAFSNEYNFSIDYILCLDKTNKHYKKLRNLNPKLIGKNLKKIRKSNKKTQEDIAKLCSIEPETYSNFERGVRLITSYDLYIICKTYNVSIDRVLGRTLVEEKIKQ